MPAKAPANARSGKSHTGERELPVLFPLSHKMPGGWGRIDAPFQSTFQGKYLVKQAVIRQVKSMSMSCDTVGNLLLVKFSYAVGKDSSVLVPASIVFWLLDHMPVNQDPELQQPMGAPQIFQQDWDDRTTPRALSVQCKQFPDAIRITMELDRKPGLTVLLDRGNVELMRQIMAHYHSDLINLDA